ncbi:MAG: DUF3500 domain-containing protein [Planctomycetota bacterium]
MSIPFSKSFVGTLACVLLVPYSAGAKERPAARVSNEMREAAIDFLASLDETLRVQATFEFQGSERTDWHFIPKDRVGVSFKEMTLPQRRAARVLMRSVLSEKGYFKATTIMSLEQVLRALEAGRENVENIRDPEKYWFAVFGNPAGQQPWGWRVEGHHLSLNFTSVDGAIVGTAPIFMGSNPAEVRQGSLVGLRVLGTEEDQARKLMSLLSAEQKAKAIFSDQAPRDVYTVPGKTIDLGTPVGIAAEEMTPRQRALLKQMVASFLRHLRNQLAVEEIHAVEKAGIKKIHFAWAGGLSREENHYFRLHGPTFVLEYDNAQGNHAHLVWHSKDSEFGAAALRQHYETSPHHQAESE